MAMTERTTERAPVTEPLESIDGANTDINTEYNNNTDIDTDTDLDTCPTTDPQSNSRLFKLAPELRNQIYGYVFAALHEKPICLDDVVQAAPNINLALTCRRLCDETITLYREAFPVFWSANNFAVSSDLTYDQSQITARHIDRIGCIDLDALFNDGRRKDRTFKFQLDLATTTNKFFCWSLVSLGESKASDIRTVTRSWRDSRAFSLITGPEILGIVNTAIRFCYFKRGSVSSVPIVNLEAPADLKMHDLNDSLRILLSKTTLSIDD